jgi:hypothetical protein
MSTASEPRSPTSHAHTHGNAPAPVPLLRGVTYSEFDNKVGPRLKFQYPPDAISSDDFESMAEYVIVGKHLCGKIITVRNEDIQFVNYSVAIDNPKYDRNTLLFAVGFVLDKDTDTVRIYFSKLYAIICYTVV